MRLNITDLSAEGVRMADRLDPLQFKDLAALQEDQACTFKGPLAVFLEVTPTAGLFQVAGRIQGRAEMACNRCLARTELPLNSDFRLTFARSLPGSGEGPQPNDRELTAVDMGLVFFEGDVIDFRDAIQEQTILAIPMHVLCREDCHGLCPGCGVDLNREDCRCAPDDVDPRLAILKTLKREP
jgi:uncharacterized protein